MDNMWKRLPEKFELEVLETKVEVNKVRSIQRKRAAVEVKDGPEGQKYEPCQMGEDCWARIFSWFREYDLQQKKGMQ